MWTSRTAGISFLIVVHNDRRRREGGGKGKGGEGGRGGGRNPSISGEQVFGDAKIWVDLIFAEKALYPRESFSLLKLGQLFTLLFIDLSIHLVILCGNPPINSRAGCSEGVVEVGESESSLGSPQCWRTEPIETDTKEGTAVTGAAQDFGSRLPMFSWGK